jgi:hypothetical protein
MNRAANIKNLPHKGTQKDTEPERPSNWFSVLTPLVTVGAMATAIAVMAVSEIREGNRQEAKEDKAANMVIESYLRSQGSIVGLNESVQIPKVDFPQRVDSHISSESLEPGSGPIFIKLPQDLTHHIETKKTYRIIPGPAQNGGITGAYDTDEKLVPGLSYRLTEYSDPVANEPSYYVSSTDELADTQAKLRKDINEDGKVAYYLDIMSNLTDAPEASMLVLSPTGPSNTTNIS